MDPHWGWLAVFQSPAFPLGFYFFSWWFFFSHESLNCCLTPIQESYLCPQSFLPCRSPFYQLPCSSCSKLSNFLKNLKDGYTSVLDHSWIPEKQGKEFTNALHMKYITALVLYFLQKSRLLTYSLVQYYPKSYFLNAYILFSTVCEMSRSQWKLWEWKTSHSASSQ